ATDWGRECSCDPPAWGPSADRRGYPRGRRSTGSPPSRAAWRGWWCDESGERLDRDGIRRELGAGDAALGLHAVTLPAAVLDIGRLALLGRGGERAATARET